MNNTANKNPNIAYFCMEFGLSKNLRIYAGGLGKMETFNGLTFDPKDSSWQGLSGNYIITLGECG